MRFNLGNDNWTEAVTDIAPIELLVDATTNDSDKTFTVPDGEMWKLNYVFTTLTTSAAAGNRQMVVDVADASGTGLWGISAGAVQAASLTRRYSYVPGTSREAAFVNTEIQVPIPENSFIPGGGTIRVYDSAAIAAAADDMIVSISAKVYKGV